MRKIKNIFINFMWAVLFAAGAAGPANAAITVSISTADVSPASFVSGEQAAALRITPYTNYGETVFSSMTVNFSGNACSVGVAALYYDTDRSNTWTAGDRLVSSSTLNNCASYVTFLSSETVDTQKISYFIVVTLRGGDEVSLELTSANSFKFDAAMAAQAIYPVSVALKEALPASDSFLMVSDDAGGAYMVYDSTVAAGGFRKIFAKRVDANNSATWGPVEVSPGYYPVEKGSELFADSDGAGGVLVAWFGSSGVAYAQRYNASGSALWTPGGMQVSSGATLGGEFVRNSGGGLFALFGYPSAGSPVFAAQSVSNVGMCQWPTPGNCVTSSTGTVSSSIGDFSGRGQAIDGGSGSLVFAWGGVGGSGRMELYALKIAAGGELAWDKKTLSATGGDEAGDNLDGISDGMGGTYLVWGSSTGGAQALYARRFDSAGDPASGWTSALQLSSYSVTGEYAIKLAKDQDGFTVLFSTHYSMDSKLSVVRASATVSALAGGWPLNGYFAGRGNLSGGTGLVYDGSAYHCVWSRGWPFNTVYYQRVEKDGVSMFTGGGYTAGTFQDFANTDVSIDGAGGALVGWKTEIGGADIPVLQLIPGTTGPVLVSLSAADVSPDIFMRGEEAAVLRITPYTSEAATVFSSMTVRLNPGMNTCSFRAAALYYDTDRSDTWDSGDRLVSSVTLSNCAPFVTFLSSEAVSTQKIAYFITVTPNYPDNISLEISSATSFEFGAALAAQAIYPIVSAVKGGAKGSNALRMISDGAGGAYMVYDSTVAAGGLRRVFAKRVDAHNSAIWGPVAVSPGYNSQNENGELFAGRDGAGGLIAAWFDAAGLAFAQRYNAAGARQWADGGVQVSSSATEGGEFQENTASGGFFAVFGYPAGGGMTVVGQSVDNSGQCQWPSGPGDCVNSSLGTVIPIGGMDGGVRGIDTGFGSLIFAWAENNGGRLELYASKINVVGTLGWNKITLSSSAASDEGINVEGVGDGTGGAYLVWTSSTGGAQALYAKRFGADGNAFNPGWTSSLCISSSAVADEYEIKVAKDQDGFAVLYSTMGNNGGGDSVLRIVRSSAAVSALAPGWTLNKFAGRGKLGQDSLVYDGSNYHFMWSRQWPYNTISYQRMDKSGVYTFANSGYTAGNFEGQVMTAVSPDGAGGALAGWKTETGGADIPVLKLLPASPGIVMVHLSTADVSPAIFMAGEESPVLRIAPYTDSGKTVLSSMTVQFVGNACSVGAAALYYDTDRSSTWNAGDRLVSSSTLGNCAGYVNFLSSETVDTQRIAYFITLTPAFADNISLAIPSSASFKFDETMAADPVYPIVSTSRGGGAGTDDFRMISDGAGGAYIVYDSTVAAGGLRRMFAKRVDANNSAIWGPVALSTSYNSAANGGDAFAGSDGAGGLIAAWFDGGGFAYAQRYSAAGVRQWAEGGVQISSSATDGGEFRVNVSGGLFAVFGYPTGGGVTVVGQSVNNSGQCLWPSGTPGDCLTASEGTIIPVGGMDGGGRGIDGGSGSLWFAWAELNGGRLELYGSKVAAGGTLAINKVTLSSGATSDEGNNIEGISDGAGGAYLVWTSSSGGTQALYSKRFGSNGSSYSAGWSSALQISSYAATDNGYTINIVKDEDAFTVFYSTGEGNGNSRQSIVRVSSATGSLAAGWTINKFAGRGRLTADSLVYDGSDYHFVWSRDWPYNTVNYQKMDKAGVYVYADSGYIAGNISKYVMTGVSVAGSGGGLAGWKSDTGGGDIPVLRLIPAGAGAPVRVYLSTADVSPGSFVTGEEAAVLRITPYASEGETAFSSMTVRLNPGGNTCALQAVALYYDTDQSETWGAGDRLVSSTTLGCAAYHTFSFPAETLGTQQIAYFISATPGGMDNISLELTSTASFKFADAMATQAIYPIVSAPRSVASGSNDFHMVSDGEGGAYMVYDSTVAAGGLRKIFARRVDAENAVVWGPYEASTGYYSGEKYGDSFAASDGAGGVVAAWFDGSGVAYAQRYNAAGAEQWATGGVQLSSGATEGGFFTANAAGGIFALFAYSTGGGMELVAQKVTAAGDCQWPSSGNCISASTGTVLPITDFSGDGHGLDGGSGSLFFAWGGKNGGSGRLELYGSRVAANGTLAWNQKLLSATSGDEGNAVKGISDGAGGAYLVWTSSNGGAQALYTERFDANGDAAPGWAAPLQLSSAYVTDRYEINLAKDETGFAVLYSTGGNGQSEVRIVRSSATANQLAAGWSLNGLLAGRTVDNAHAIIYSSFAYHFAWNQDAFYPAFNTHQVNYQRSDKDGNFSYQGNGFVAGTAPSHVKVRIASDGGAGALAGWKSALGGSDVPGLRHISAGGSSGPVFTGNFSLPGGAVYDGGSKDSANGVAVDTITVGGPYIYTVGGTSNTVTGRLDGILIKYNSAGIVLASATLVNAEGNGTAQFMAVAVDPSGNVVVSGYDTGIPAIKFNPSLQVLASSRTAGNTAFAMAFDGTSPIIVGGSGMFDQDWFVKKFDSGMQLQYQAGYDGPVGGGNEYAYGVVVGSGGYIFVSGSSNNGATKDWLLRKYGPTLNFVSSATFASNMSTGSWGAPGLTMDRDGNLLVYGEYYNGSFTESAIRKYDQTLNYISSATFNYVGGLRTAPNGDLVLSAGDSIQRLTSSFAWVSSAPVSYAQWLALDNLGYAYTAGSEYVGESDNIHTEKTFIGGAAAGGGVITGTVAYGGSQQGQTVVAVFVSSTFAGEPDYVVMVDTSGAQPWTYSTPALPAGTYYTVSIILTQGFEGQMQLTDPWAIWGSTNNPAPVVVSSGPSSGIDFTLVDGTVENPNPFAQPAGAGFTGNFAQPGGAVYDNGDIDAGLGVAYFGSNVYVVGISSPDGAIVVKYNLAGFMLSSATMSGVESFDGVAVNANGVYAAGKGATGFMTAKYDHNLVLSSAAVLPGENHARGVALDMAGNVYVIGSNFGEAASQDDYKLVKYNAALNQLGAPALFNAGGVDSGSGIAYSSGSIYITGNSLTGSATYFVTARYDSGTLAFISSAVYSGTAYVDPEHPVGGKLAANQVTRDLYLVSSSSHNKILTVRYDAAMTEQETAEYQSAYYAQGVDVKLDAAGDVYVAGGYNAGAADFPMLLKYSPTLVFKAGAASVQAYGYEPVGLALNPATGDSYVTGLYFSDGTQDMSKWDMRTVHFDPLFESTAPAAGVTGTVAYGGSQQGATVVAVFVSSTFAGDPDYVVMVDTSGAQPWTYTTPALPAGTYYLVSAILTQGFEGQMQLTDPWAIWGSTNNPAPVVVSSGPSSGIDFALVDGTVENPNPFAGPSAAGFTGNFSLPGGAVYDGGDRDIGRDIAFYNSNVYVVVESSPAGSLVVKYDAAGTVLSSDTINATSRGLAVGPAGVYVAARDNIAGFITRKYTQDLVLVSSAALAGDPSAEQLVLDDSGNVYVIGSNWGESGSAKDFKLVKYNPGLAAMISSAAFNAGGADEGRGIAYDNGYIYITGDSLTGSATNFVTAKFDATTLAFVSSAAYANGYYGGPKRTRLVANPATHDIYLVATEGNQASRQMVTVRYSQDLNQLAAAVVPPSDRQHAYDVEMDTAGNVYALGKDYDTLEYAFVVKYSPGLVVLSSEAFSPAAANYHGTALSLDLATGDSYLTGYTSLSGGPDATADMRTIRVAPLAGQLPVIYVSTRDVSPAFYQVDREAAALELTFQTLSGQADISGINVSINPSGDPAAIAAVAFYKDSNPPYGAWDAGDELVSSAPVAASPFVTLPVAGGTIDETPRTGFLTLTPAFAGAGGLARVALLSTAAFSTTGNMALQAMYPIFSAAKTVQVGAGSFSGNFAAAAGAVYSDSAHDIGTAMALNPATGDIYVVGISSVGRDQGLIVKYNSSGVMTASAPVTNAGGLYLMGVAVNANGVYASGGLNDASNSVTLRYDYDLRLISSATLAGVHSPRVALGADGSVFLSGSSDIDGNYHLAKYGPDLTGLSTATFDSGNGNDTAGGIVADDPFVYMTGTSLLDGATYFVTSKFNASSLAFISSAAYAGAYSDDELRWVRLTVNPVTHDVYLAGTEGTENNRHILTVRYSQDLQQLAEAAYTDGGNYQLGFDVALDSAGYVYTVGKDYAAYDYAVLLKYSPNLLFISSAASSAAIAGDYIPFAVALDTASGYAYATGGGLAPSADMRTIRFDSMTGELPVVYVSTQDVSPAFYQVGREAAALRLTLYTMSGLTQVSSLKVNVNPAGSYADIASVGLYGDSDSNGTWDPELDTLFSSAAVSSPFADLSIPDGLIDTELRAAFITLTPAFAGAGGSVGVAVQSTAAFTTTGNMAPQAIYPISPAARTVQVGAGVFSGDFSLPEGAVYSDSGFDLGTAMARNKATGDIYVVGISSVEGKEQGLIVKYDSSGIMTASAPIVNAGGMYLLGVAVNANGVYASGGISGSHNAVTLKYDHNLQLLASTTTTSMHSPRVALDSLGNVYLAGSSEIDDNYHLAKYGPNLTGIASVTLDAGNGKDTAGGLLLNNGSVYMTGTSLLSGATYYVTSRFNASNLAFISSAAYAGAYGSADMKWARLAVNRATGDIYLAGTEGTEENRHILTVRYSQNLQQLASAVFTGAGNYQLGFDVTLDSDGYVYTVGKGYAAYDYAVLLKYSPNLVYISSAASSSGITSDYLPFAVTLDTTSGYSYVTGGGFDAMSDMRTLRFEPLTGLLPVVYVSAQNITPAFYLAGQEAAALRITPYTLAGEVDFTGLQVRINPAGPYTDIASVALYDDTDEDGIWNSQYDTLLSSGAVTSSIYTFGTQEGIVDTRQAALFITLTPTVAGEGSNVNVAVLSTASFITAGNMAPQGIYPIASAPTLVQGLFRLTDLAAEPGAGLDSVILGWTYPQDITAGHYIIRYSTDKADLNSGPNIDANRTITPISAITADDEGGSSAFELPLISSGMRVFPYYFRAWLFNGTSTSTASNLAQNLYFPVTSVSDLDATLKTREALYAGPDSGARFAKSTSTVGAYSAVTFYSGSDYFLAINTPNGDSYFYKDPVQLDIKAMSVDQTQNVNILAQKGYDVLAVKFAPDGAVLAISTFTNETAKAITNGAGAVYAATEYDAGGSEGTNIRLRKLEKNTLSQLLIANYDSSLSLGYGSNDEVNSLAFTRDAFGNKILYVAGASGQYPLSGRLHKFTDTDAAISTAVLGNWPIQYSNPSGGESRALVVKTDLNNNPTVAGTEQRYDLDQADNIWLMRYSPYGVPMLASPARYNNAQANADDTPTWMDFDSFGNIYVSGNTYMWDSQGMLLAKFNPGGQLVYGRVYNSGYGYYNTGSSVFVSSDNYVHVAGSFGGLFGVYSMPLGSSVNTQFFTAAEGPYAGSADLLWNYIGALPAGSTYYIQYSVDPAPVWSRAAAQIAVSTGPLYPGEVQLHSVGGLPALRYPGTVQETRGNLYKFKVWITSGGLTTELPVAQTFARTPFAYDNTQEFGRERLSFMSGLSGAGGGGIAVEGSYVYHAFGGNADGVSAGFGLRKYNADQYLEWTKFFNHKDDRAYYVANMTRDEAGNFYLVGSERLPDPAAAAPEYLVAGKDMWIAKLDGNGDLVWSYSADASGSGRMDELYDVAVEGSSLYVVGVASTVANGMDILARKYDISPSTYPALVWSQGTNTNGTANGDDFGYGVAVGTGAVYLSGTLNDTGTGDNLVVQALDKGTGSASTVVNSAASGGEEGYDLAVTTDGYIYVAGSTAAVSQADAALFKYNLAGALLWARSFDGKDNLDDAVYSVKANGSGVIVAGYETTAGQGKNSIYRKFNHDGEVEWSRGFDFSNGGDDETYSLAADDEGRIYSAVLLQDGHPGFYYFPEPSFRVLANEYQVPGSVRLDWMSQVEVPAGSVFSIQYSTYNGGWNSAAAQVRSAVDENVWEGMNVTRMVYGLDNSRDAQGTPAAPDYFFKVWYSTPSGPPTLVSDVPASARPSVGWAAEGMVMYPNQGRLFVMRDEQGYGSGEKEFPGIARDSSGNLYTLANLNWNGSGGFAVKKFNSSMAQQWTRYYAPGEYYSVRANRMAADAGGSLYITGYERGSGTAEKDLFVMKFGGEGLAWKTTYNFADGDDTGYGVALDASGNVYAAGSVYTGSDDNIFVAKLDSAGVILSSANYAGAGSGPDAAYGIAVQGGNVYVTGSAYDAVQGAQLWTGKLSSSGLSLAASTATGTSASGYDVIVDTSGYVYVAGEIYSSENGNSDAVLIKSSANLSAVNGLFPILYNSQGNANDAAYGLAIDAAGSVYAAGSQERYDINQDKNLWLRKYSQEGAELWSQEFHSNAIPGDYYASGANSDEGFSLAVGTMSFVSVGGKFNGYYGLYRYRQSGVAVNPLLTVQVSSRTLGVPFPGVAVSLIPYSQTGGIDVSGIKSSVTSPSGTASFRVPTGKLYLVTLDRQGFNPGVKDQLMDPTGSFLVQPEADMTRQYILSPQSDPYYPLTVTVTSATAGDYIVAEVVFAQTGEKAAYGIGRVGTGVGASSVTFTVNNVPPMSAGVYTLGAAIPARSLSRSIPMGAAFPQTSAYTLSMSTSVVIAADSNLPSIEGIVRNFRTSAPLEEVRIRLWNTASTSTCTGMDCDYNVYETLTDVYGRYSFYDVVASTALYRLAAQKAGYKRAGAPPVSKLPGAAAATVYQDFLMQESTYTLRGIIRYRDAAVPDAHVMVYGDYSAYSGSDSYRGARGMDTDARARTAADGTFVFSSATLNGLPDGQLRMSVAFFGNWLDLNEGNIQNAAVDADDVRIVISSSTATGVAGCSKGRNWLLWAKTGVCKMAGDLSFNLMPQAQNDYALLSGSVTFVTTFTVSGASPLVISSMSPVTIMAMQECSGDCKDRSMGFAALSGVFKTNVATYSITLSTGISYYTRVTSNEWAEISAFDDRADFRSTSTLSVLMNFVVTKAGVLKGVVKMPDGSNYKPALSLPAERRHGMEISVRGQNVDVSEGWRVDDYGAFAFPNLAPGLYTITMRPIGLGFRWAAPTMSDIAVVAGKTTQVTLRLADGLVVQPQIIGLPEISTPAWTYKMIPVESGTEMNQKKITELFFGSDVFAFNYSTATQTWDKKMMLTGQYDFYLMLGARYSPEGGEGYPDPDHFGNFIGKVKGFAVQRVENSPNLGTDAQPIPVSVLGSLGQDSFEGTILGERMYTDADLDRVFSNFNEIFQLIPAVMVYDEAGDLRGYTAGLPSSADFGAFWSAMLSKDKTLLKAFFAAHSSRFMIPGMPPGRYTVVFNNPNYPPITKEVNIPLASSYNGSYPFNFEEQRVRTGSISGYVRKSTAAASGLSNAVVYLKHRTVEKFTNTDSDGYYAFSNMPSGIYRLEVMREGYVKAGQKTSLTGSLRGDDEARLDFYLTPSQSNMVGKVYMSKFPVPLTKSGVKIVAYDETYNTERPSDYLPTIEATTNDSGEYELTGVVPGHNYKVSAFFGSKLPATLDIAGTAVTEGVTYLPDIVLREAQPQIMVKVRKSPDSVNKVDITIKSPKQLVSTPVCKVNTGESYVAATAVSLALVPGPNHTYLGQFTVSRTQPYYNVYVSAGDGSSKMEKSVTYSPNNQAKTEQYIQDESIKGGSVQMDQESEEYSGIELDAGALLSTASASASGTSGYTTSATSDLVGGFFSALPSVRTVKTAKGDLSLTQALQDLMASEVYNMELANASVNKPFTLTLKYDKDKAAEGSNLRIYQYDEATGLWKEVPGDYTVDPMLGVLSVGVGGLANAYEGTGGVNTPLMRKRFGMSAVVNGRYVPSAAAVTSQSGRFAVFTAMPPTGISYSASAYEVYNMPNPFSLKAKTVTNLEGTAAFSGNSTYDTSGTIIKYHLPPGRSGSVKFVIYNMAGEKVRTIDDSSRAGGAVYYSEWDGKNDNGAKCASGVYFMLTYLDGKQLGDKAHKMAIIK